MAFFGQKSRSRGPTTSRLLGSSSSPTLRIVAARATSNVRRRRAARMEPVRRDPQLPVDARVAHVADRRGHRLHGVRSHRRPPPVCYDVTVADEACAALGRGVRKPPCGCCGWRWRAARRRRPWPPLPLSSTTGRAGSHIPHCCSFLCSENR